MIRPHVRDGRDHALQLHVDGGDDLDIDDTRILVVTVKDTMPVASWERQTEGRYFQRPNRIFTAVFAQSVSADGEPKSADMTKVVSALLFLDLDQNDSAYDCFLLRHEQFRPGRSRRIEIHLRRGGGVVFTMGERRPRTSEVYNRSLYKNARDSRPAQVFKKIVAPAEHDFLFEAKEEATWSRRSRRLLLRKIKWALRFGAAFTSTSRPRQCKTPRSAPSCRSTRK